MIERELNLRTEFGIAWESIGNPAFSTDIAWRGLVAEYSRPGRYYHNLNHILNGLKFLGTTHRDFVSNTLKVAWFFHDLKEKPQDSALCFKYMVHSDVDGPLVGRVTDLIMMTDTHVLTGDVDADKAAIVNADLSILASPEVQYRAYAYAVRAEYAEFTDDEYAIGRMQLLFSFMNRKKIFAGLPQLEQPAKDNIRREWYYWNHVREIKGI